MPVKRTTEHFKFRNHAVRQATYLGVDKLVLITIAKFAHDDGIFWHGYRTIARTSGVSVGQAYKSIQKFINDGVLVLITKGKPGYSKVTSTYQIVLEKIPLHPSVYDLVKHHAAEERDANRSPDERTESADTRVNDPVGDSEEGARSLHERTERNRSPDERTDNARSYSERSSFTTRTEGVDFDVDLPQGVDSNIDGDGSAASPPSDAPFLNLFEGQSPKPSQSQNRVGVHGAKSHALEASKRAEKAKSKLAAFLDGEEESNPNPKISPMAQSPRSVDPPKLVNNDDGVNCRYCSQAWGQPHHRTCFHVTGRFA